MGHIAGELVVPMATYIHAHVHRGLGESSLFTFYANIPISQNIKLTKLYFLTFNLLSRLAMRHVHVICEL